MEPQIIDYYNEMPSGVNVIEKMNEELAQVQKENDELKKKLESKQREEPPVVIYKDQEELDRVKEEAYGEFYNRFKKVNLGPWFIHPHLMNAIDILLTKLLKDNKERSLWPDSKAFEIQTYIGLTIGPLKESNGYLDYDLIYNIIKNNIEEMFEPEECYGIVKFRCEKCNELDDYLVDGECHECRFPDSDD